MQLNDTLQLINVTNNAAVDSKKSVLELLSKLLAQNIQDLGYIEILDNLLEREKLGSTGIGHGVAIPHGRNIKVIKPIAALVRTQNPIDFAAVDNKPVDLFFALLLPETNVEPYLDILANVAKKLRNKKIREKLRQAENDIELYNLVIADSQSNSSA